jgi:hypothetical protein
MIVSIWNHNGEDMSSAFQAALSLTAVCTMPCSIIMLESVANSKVLGDVLLDVNYSNQLKEDTVYRTLTNYGDGLADYVSSRYNKRIKGINAIEIIRESLYYLPQFLYQKSDVYDRLLCCDIYSYMLEAEQIADYTVINAARAESMASVEVIDAADKVIILIGPNYLDCSAFMDMYRSILSKCYFVVFAQKGTFENDINWLYSKLGIKPDRFFALPYTNEFTRCVQAGTILEYFQQFWNCNKYSSEFKLMNGFKNLSEVIFGRGYEGINLRAAELTNIIQRKQSTHNSRGSKTKKSRK